MNLFQKYKLLTEKREQSSKDNLFSLVKSLVESTENFKKWFGKSVLHDNSKPHTYYHGTGSKSEETN